MNVDFGDARKIFHIEGSDFSHLLGERNGDYFDVIHLVANRLIFIHQGLK